MNQVITIAALIVFAAQLIFVVNFFYSIWKGRELKVQNPWGATTLEWTTPIKNIHGNWPDKIPTVHRWCYDYSKDEDSDIDYIPQVVPLAEGEKTDGAH
jgi:cytochrome c oxidase subunit 1